MELDLRSQCKSLLGKLKTSQKNLTCKFLPNSSSSQDSDFQYNTKASDVTKDITQLAISDDPTMTMKPAYARDKLSGLSRVSQNPSKKIPREETDFTSDRHLIKDSNLQDLNKLRQHLSSQHESENSYSKYVNKNDIDPNYVADIYDETQTSWLPATPNTMRKRQLIDRHTNVPTKLNADELKELNNERLLNFDYCHINVDDDVTKLTKVSHSQTEEDKENSENLTNNPESSIKTDKKSSASCIKFRDQLQDDGNNRNYSTWIRETSMKPKTLLNSNAYYSLKPCRKATSRVRFDSSVNPDSPELDQRLLGYDWIAALLDNDSNLVDQSESFFDEIKDFRKAFKGECSNRFYKETPYTLVDTEPEPIAEALTDPKVRPYIVNDRLFTEPLKPGIIDYEDDSCSKSKEPTEKNPRFVRVSIPRSTLQTPYRMKPHRRGSFDGSDSCALMDHCLLGWENSCPVTLPSAKTLDLNSDAGTRIDSEITTLAEAERLATEHNRVQWPFSKPNARLQTLPTWRRHYMNTTMNMTLPSSSANITNSSSDQSIQGRKDIKRATDKILSATYSTMYEMERLRQERELERKS